MRAPRSGLISYLLASQLLFHYQLSGLAGVARQPAVYYIFFRRRNDGMAIRSPFKFTAFLFRHGSYNINSGSAITSTFENIQRRAVVFEIFNEGKGRFARTRCTLESEDAQIFLCSVNQEIRRTIKTQEIRS